MINRTVSRQRRLMVSVSLALLVPCLHTPAHAQAPVRIVVGWPAGGGVDAVARLLADQLEKQTRRPHLVENKTGATGIIAVRSMLGAPADGSVLLLTPDSSLVVYPHTVAAPGFNALTDLAPVARVAAYDFALSVRAGEPDIRSLDALRQAIKSNAMKATFASPGAGGLLHFYGVAVSHAIGLDLTHVSYRGVAPAITDTLAGEVTALFTPVGPVLQHADAGRLRVLATSGPERGSKTPDVPTFKELGYPQLTAHGWFGLFAPAKASSEVVQRLSESVRRALADPALRAKFAALDMEAAWSNPQDFHIEVESESKRWAGVVKGSGFRADQ